MVHRMEALNTKVFLSQVLGGGGRETMPAQSLHLGSQDQVGMSGREGVLGRTPGKQPMNRILEGGLQSLNVVKWAVHFPLGTKSLL